MNDRPRLHLRSLLHGGDYNPEQWPKSVWPEDMALMDAARMNAASVGIFSWVELEPAEGQYDFAWLDEVMELLHARSTHIILATPSASPPAWMSQAYPEILRTGSDRVRRLHGNRVNYCWTSPIYRTKTAEISRQLAQRYGNHPSLTLWHVSNEYGGECYCELCRARFIEWLQAKFDGDLDRLNGAYWTSFWGHRFTDWSQLDLPGEPYGETAIQGLTLDFRRFCTDQIIDFFKNESAPLREISPNIPLTTNLMGLYPGLNAWKIAPHLDVVSWDSYPQFTKEPWSVRNWARTAMAHDAMRCAGGGKPWLLMECTPSSSNWYPVMNLKAPGVHNFEAMQALAHGSDSVMYFQWRQCRGGQEKLHGAVVGHGTGQDSRVFKEVAEVGATLEQLSQYQGGTVIGSLVTAEVALIYDWENAWALEGSCGPVPPNEKGDKRYQQTCLDHYMPLWDTGVSVDVIDSGVDFSPYRLVIAPMLYLLKPGVADRMSEFVASGGTLLATYLTGWVDENDLLFEEGPMAPLRDLFGVAPEEIDALYPDQTLSVVLPGGQHIGVEGAFSARDFAELFTVRDAEVLATYGKSWYSERPAITRRKQGKGQAIYIGARVGMDFLEPYLTSLVGSLGLKRNYPHALPAGVTVQRRHYGEDEYLFLLNASGVSAHLAPPDDPYVEILSGRAVQHGITLPPHGCAVLRPGTIS